ncbi:hypothetical protein H6P81_004599 [Aristolochia fimbriata]|uniref:Phosphatidylinositol N-acetylglucosaminyltransferase subunit H conserved domain-containing protein n=1 Tax=Aristolochia fimbriata TaxID=158543 RepID=A0AAV7ES50_ARIFI|nr:hypothetical protein H6P81_004599 [Aristolochia fimbriata]
MISISRFLMEDSGEVPQSLGRYSYIHDAESGFSEAVDQHHILVRRRKARKFLLYFVSSLLLVYIGYLLLIKESLGTSPLLIIPLAVIIVRSSYQISVEKESIIIMPSLGVQLVTHYMSGNTERRFVPIGKILKPLLNECVTPVTCYWSLALLVRGEPELMLVFQKLRPPVKMLIPVWKALCSATSEGSTMLETDDGHESSSYLISRGVGSESR